MNMNKINNIMGTPEITENGASISNTQESKGEKTKEERKPEKKKGAEKRPKTKKESYPDDYRKRDEVEKMSDQELFELAEKAKGNTNEFSKIAECAFTYSVLTNILAARGFKNGWYKPELFLGDTEIRYKKAKGASTRMYLTVSEDTAKDWKGFRELFPQDAGFNDLALKRFMDDIRSGRFKIVMGGDGVVSGPSSEDATDGNTGP